MLFLLSNHQYQSTQGTELSLLLLFKKGKGFPYTLPSVGMLLFIIIIIFKNCLSATNLPFTFLLVGSRWWRRTPAFVCLLLTFLVRLTHRNELQQQWYTVHHNITTMPQTYHSALLLEKSAKMLKGFPYSSPSVGPGANPSVQAVSPQVTISHPPGSRLPLLSARPAVTFPAAEHHRPLARTKLYCLVTEAHTCENFPRLLCSFAPSRIWAHNLLIESTMIYPLRHSATKDAKCRLKFHISICDTDLILCQTNPSPCSFTVLRLQTITITVLKETVSTCHNVSSKFCLQKQEQTVLNHYSQKHSKTTDLIIVHKIIFFIHPLVEFFKIQQP